MINNSSFLHLPYTPDLTEGGIAFALRSLAYNNTPYNRMSRIAAGVAVELAFRRYLSSQNIPYEIAASMPLAERVKVPGLDPGRATVIVAGALILETIVALAGLDSTMVSEHDILYGILLETYDDLREDRSGVEQELGE